MDDNQQRPVTDDQELANVLAGMNEQAAQASTTLTNADPRTNDEPAKDESAPITTPELQFESPAPTDNTSSLPPVDAPALDSPTLDLVVQPEPTLSSFEPITPVTPLGTTSTVAPSASPELDSIKKEALEQLRPLVDKLDLPPDEKFDTLLLLIRSTDDKTLVSATFEAAKSIPDENKRAQALLDVIKEIDYFSGHGEQPAA